MFDIMAELKKLHTLKGAAYSKQVELIVSKTLDISKTMRIFATRYTK